MLLGGRLAPAETTKSSAREPALFVLLEGEEGIGILDCGVVELLLGALLRRERGVLAGCVGIRLEHRGNGGEGRGHSTVTFTFTFNL